VGVGSTFFFTARFQVQQDQSERTAQDTPQTTHASLAELEARAAGLRILLVDDSEDNRILILSYLKKTRSTIDIAEDGQRAVEFFRTGHYDVVLMDVEMPVMDGYQATREIRRIEKESGAPPTPVLALTAHAFAEMKVKGYEAGFTDLLTKPIRQTTLLEALAKHGSSGGSGSSEAERPVVAPASIRIRVEEGMEDVVPGYLAKRRAEVAVYRERLGAGDFDAIRKLAHKMKGTGGGYGFPKLTELGAALEKGAIQSDTSAIRENLDEFALYLESVKLEYLS
jgi:CheY-like chemotaxis protein/HPt (histidine-containing phosphotransfer) domain-containing protein